MKLNYKQIAIGMVLGYVFRDKIGGVVSKFGAIDFGAIKLNPHSAFDQTQAWPHAARGPEGFGALHMNPGHMGAIHTNPAHMGALHMNPGHMGAIHTNPAHMGALHMGAIELS